VSCNSSFFSEVHFVSALAIPFWEWPCIRRWRIWRLTRWCRWGYEIKDILVSCIRLQDTAGVFILVRNYIYPLPLFQKWYFSPSRDIIFRLLSWPFCLDSSLHLLAYFCIYFSLSSFFFIFSHFYLPLFKFFPQMTWANIPSGGGGGIFQYIDSWDTVLRKRCMWLNRWTCSAENKPLL
jgi:hypothetical protein